MWENGSWGKAGECKGKVHPIACHEGTEGSRGVALLFL